jgi:hypothetical protein
MKRTEDEFWNSSFAKVVSMIDMYADEMQLQAAAMKNEKYQSKYFGQKEEVRYVNSMKETEGW